VSIEQALGEYCQERFTDDDVIRCTGLSFRAWRELLRTRAVRTISEKRGRGRVRLCDATTLKRAAAIAAINQAGLSLPVSGQIAYWWPVHSLLFEVCDPRSIGALTRPNVDWFEPNRPAGSEPGDWLIEFYDSRFVGARYGRTNEPAIFGDVRDAGMRFVAWYPSHSKQHVIGTAIEQLAGKILPYHPSVDFTANRENVVVRHFPQVLKTLGYKFENRSIDDPLRRAAANAVHNAVVVLTVNPTLAIRKALRRYLGLEPDLVVAKQSQRRRR
jgi:hypothetical protein